MNDGDREDRVDNDEGLYLWWRSSRMSKRAFVRANRAELTAAIEAVLSSSQPAHFLAYGPAARCQP
jgi:hypothetical protein